MFYADKYEYVKDSGRLITQLRRSDEQQSPKNLMFHFEIYLHIS